MGSDTMQETSTSKVFVADMRRPIEVLLGTHTKCSRRGHFSSLYTIYQAVENVGSTLDWS